MSGSDPYVVLGVSPGVDDAQLRAAYRHAVQRHHPDHNGGSAESARRFEAIQAAYAQVREQRASGATRTGSSSPRASASAASTTDPGLNARLAAMEQELAAAREAQERARRAAREAADDAARAAGSGRPSDEDLGYVNTKDSFSSILSDAAAGLSDRLSQARAGSDARPESGEPLNERVADLFEDLGARLRGERSERRD